MLFTNQTTNTILRRDLGGAAPKEVATFTADGKTEQMNFDGKIEDAVVRSTLGDPLVTDLKQVSKMMASPEVKGAQEQLEAGEEKVKVKHNDISWTATKNQNGSYQFNNSDAILGSNEIRSRGNQVQLSVGGLAADGSSIVQTVRGSMNPNGTITCDMEQMTTTASLSSL